MTRSQWMAFSLTASILFLIGVVIHPNDRPGYVIGVIALNVVLVIVTLSQKEDD